MPGIKDTDAIHLATTDLPELSGFIIRRAEFTDADILADLITQLGYPTCADKVIMRLRELLTRSEDHLAAVGDWRGNVVGVICAARSFHIEYDESYGRITALSVDENYRGRGIGSVLLTYAESWLRSRGAVICIVNSHMRRHDAHRFYQREGYLHTGYRLEKKWPL